jgi:hypothetical protein
MVCKVFRPFGIAGARAIGDFTSICSSLDARGDTAGGHVARGSLQFVPREEMSAALRHCAGRKIRGGLRLASAVRDIVGAIVRWRPEPRQRGSDSPRAAKRAARVLRASSPQAAMEVSPQRKSESKTSGSASAVIQ